MARYSLRYYIDLVEGQAQASWGLSQSPIFAASLTDHLRTFPDLKEKLKKFVDTKTPNPLMNRYGKHDGPMSGPLSHFLHCHLRDDAILIYKLKNRSIYLVCVVQHADIEGKRLKLTAKRVSGFA